MAGNKQVNEAINIPSFFSVMFAGILLGFIAHELVHILLIPEVTSITIRFGGSTVPVSVCCLNEGQKPLEEIAFFVQFLLTIVWIVFNRNIYLHQGNGG
ncbi:Uncharacterised protein [uncultured archaeon]|nr:Uncharacterised protein [uncultured archaeon]